MRILRSLATYAARTPVRFPSTAVQAQPPVFLLPKPSVVSTTNLCAFSTAPQELGPATKKLRDLLENYRQEHYGSLLFGRFVRQMVSLSDANNDGVLTKQEFRRFLKNMEFTTGDISDEELDEIYVEFKANDGKVDLEDIETLIDR